MRATLNVITSIVVLALASAVQANITLGTPSVTITDPSSIIVPGSSPNAVLVGADNNGIDLTGIAHMMPPLTAGTYDASIEVISLFDTGPTPWQGILSTSRDFKIINAGGDLTLPDTTVTVTTEVFEVTRGITVPPLSIVESRQLVGNGFDAIEGLGTTSSFILGVGVDYGFRVRYDVSIVMPDVDYSTVPTVVVTTEYGELNPQLDGFHASLGGAFLPEPQSAVLLLLGGLGVLRRTRQRA